ncbi:MAG: aldo/keto reductase [Bryobacterales bacterium]|nr:aldo/keto reductase [Bryobacterales bacterium]
MANFGRRDFLKSAAGLGAVAALGGTAALPAAAAVKRSATDWVTLGKSGVKVTRLAFGTGTFGGRVQRELGQAEFTKIVRHAYDRGIRFFESADAYNEMHEMLAVALKGIPRDSYRLMTKMRLSEKDPVPATLDRFRRELNSEYFDITLLHCVRTPDWSKTFEPLRDQFSALKEKKVLLSHGASCHGLMPIRQFPGNQWLDIALCRINHSGARMDTLPSEGPGLGDVKEVTGHLAKLHAQGTGVLGMKLVGEGQFKDPEARQKSLNYVFGLGTVDAVTMGFKSTAEIDEAIERINTALNA